MSGNYYFVIVSQDDIPLFELEFGAHAKPSEKVQKLDSELNLEQSILLNGYIFL
jgi:hypothetical protein